MIPTCISVPGHEQCLLHASFEICILEACVMISPDWNGSGWVYTRCLRSSGCLPTYNARTTITMYTVIHIRLSEHHMQNLHWDRRTVSEEDGLKYLSNMKHGCLSHLCVCFVRSSMVQQTDFSFSITWKPPVTQSMESGHKKMWKKMSCYTVIL